MPSPEREGLVPFHGGGRLCHSFVDVKLRLISPPQCRLQQQPQTQPKHSHLHPNNTKCTKQNATLLTIHQQLMWPLKLQYENIGMSTNTNTALYPFHLLNVPTTALPLSYHLASSRELGRYSPSPDLMGLSYSHPETGSWPLEEEKRIISKEGKDIRMT